jgi:UDP-N-acetylglucosamine transferase subunit ALG13
VRLFVTVGTQLPFDRLVSAVDDWASRHQADVFAQTGSSSLKPRHIGWKDFIDGAEANERIRTADLVVAHAGMGTILTRLETGLPMIVMPRRAALGEHRNDHQIATAKRLSHLKGLWVVDDEHALHQRMNALDHPIDGPPINACASPSLLAAVQEFMSLRI